MSVAGIAAVVVLAALPVRGYAQIDFGALLSKQLHKALDKATQHRILVSPTQITVDSATKTALIEFSNDSQDTLEAEIVLGLHAPGMIAGSGAASEGDSAKAGAAQKEKRGTDTTKATAVRDTIPQNRSLAGWVKGLPPKLKLAPGEKKTVTVKIDVPADAKSGEYAVWVITAVEVSLTGDAQFDSKGHPVSVGTSDKNGKKDESTRTRAQAGAKMVYQHTSGS